MPVGRWVIAAMAVVVVRVTTCLVVVPAHIARETRLSEFKLDLLSLGVINRTLGSMNRLWVLAVAPYILKRVGSTKARLSDKLNTTYCTALVKLDSELCIMLVASTLSQCTFQYSRTFNLCIICKCLHADSIVANNFDGSSNPRVCSSVING